MPFSSQSAIFLSELRALLPLIVLPLKTPANLWALRARGRHFTTLGCVCNTLGCFDGASLTLPTPEDPL